MRSTARRAPAGLLTVAAALLLAGCSTTSDHANGRATDAYPIPLSVLAPIYGTSVLYLLTVVVGALTVAVVIVNLAMARRGRRMPKWPLIVVAVLSGSMAILAGMLFVFVGMNQTVTIAVAGFGGGG